ncbi:hypothetical protein DV26_17655 [Amycolatopsis mediterranei]|uniref:Uncharacterized protein n=2 Tax=Amycolatopsis mediterranei TaxID=33910 RepID=A0A9R0P6Z0_AMYMS|nr:hypothetical protein RAM_45080 [Amycolatopsis mediterranei S699]KDO09505.1 hypothetical protein DV26_17655 [Amycolatopsis mediterranei]KDU90769.1 hypothetical protein DV36_18165 [Amycolatopsis mediterranei]
MRDSEIILRSLALARNLEKYSGSMVSFVNRFCLEAQLFSPGQAEEASADFKEFLEITSRLPEDTFKRSGKFSGVLFEGFFSAWVRQEKTATPDKLAKAVLSVKDGQPFADTLQEGSTKTVNVSRRIQLAEKALTSR